MKKLLFILFFALLGTLVFFANKHSEEKLEKLNKSIENRLASTSIDQDIPEEELINIKDASSEYKGKWAGLCKKDSIYSVEDFRNQAMSDPVLAQHFGDFLWSRAIVTELEDITYAQVAHRSGSIIKPTRRVLNLPKGEKVITDGIRIVRTHCCNDVYPVEEPPIKTIPPPPVYTVGTPPIYVSDEPTITPPIYYYHSGTHTHHYTPPLITAPVPEPNTLLLFSTGVCVITLLGRKKK